MYDRVDRDVATLPPVERFVVVAMRTWVAAAMQKRCPCRTLAAVFVRHALPHALPRFQMMMAVLNGDGLRQFVFGGFCTPTVTEDEAVLLSLLAADLDGDRTAAIADSLVKPAMQPVFLSAAGALRHDFASAALHDNLGNFL